MAFFGFINLGLEILIKYDISETLMLLHYFYTYILHTLAKHQYLKSRTRSNEKHFDQVISLL